MTPPLSRRSLLTATAAAAVFAAAQPAAATAADAVGVLVEGKSYFKYCLNMATIRGQKVGLVKEIEIAAAAGYDSVEPWLGTIGDFVKAGGSLRDMAKRIKDLNLTVESAIGFANWIVDDDAKRAAGLESAKRDMDAVAQLGGRRLAAPPAGATNQADLSLVKAAERYHALCEVGELMGITPMAEVWGFSKCLSRVSDTTFIALESGHKRACILPDIYHLHKGGSAFAAMDLLSPGCVQVLHMNDYPADPPREKITDAHRVYPGDGVAPITNVLRGLIRNHNQVVLSLELFNPEYWKQDALQVAKTGLVKMKAAAAKAL